MWQRLLELLPGTPGPRSRSFALVLGGGAVRGAAHVGVLEVLEDNGLRPVAVAGSSVGAIVGASYAAGRSPAEIFEGFRESGWLRIARPSLSLSLSRLHVLDTSPLRHLLGDALGLGRFEDLVIPFRAMCCDLATGEEVVLGDGDLVEAVMASAALPGLFPPVERDGRLLVDGGVVDNLPAAAARAAGIGLGADVVVACDLLARPGAWQRPRNLVDVWMETLHHLIRANQAGEEEVDLMIRPELASYPLTDFDNVDAIRDRGRRAAREAVPRLRSLLGVGS